MCPNQAVAMWLPTAFFECGAPADVRIPARSPPNDKEDLPSGDETEASCSIGA